MKQNFLIQIKIKIREFIRSGYTSAKKTPQQRMAHV